MTEKMTRSDVREFFERLDRRRELCQIRGNFLVLDAADIDYEIPLDDCVTYEDIVGWVVHLSEKDWVTMEMLRAFIVTACNYRDLKPRH